MIDGNLRTIYGTLQKKKQNKKPLDKNLGSQSTELSNKDITRVCAINV